MSRRMTLRDIETFCCELCRQERSQAAIEEYGRDVQKFYHWLPAGKKIDQEAVRNYKADLLARYVPASVNSVLAALHSFFT